MNNVYSYKVYHGFGQVPFSYGSLVLGFNVMTELFQTIVARDQMVQCVSGICTSMTYRSYGGLVFAQANFR